jgi:hypothetical protein
MFEVGSIVYFKNPSHYGCIENTDIGYRWCSEKGCDTMYTAPLFTATAGIIKSKFKVVSVMGNSEPDSMLVEVRSVDQPDLSTLVVPEFLVTNANTSSIPNSGEKRLLLYLNALSACATQATQPNKATKEEVTENPDGLNNNDKKQDNAKTHDCTNCGKCSNKQQGHRNTTKDLKDRAEQWEKVFSGGIGRYEEDFDEEPDTDSVDIDELVDMVYSEVMNRLEAKKAEEKLKSFRNPYDEYGPFYWGSAIPVNRPINRKVTKNLDEFIREIFG